MRTISDQLIEEVPDEWEPEGYYFNERIHGRKRKPPVRVKTPWYFDPEEEEDIDRRLRQLEEEV
jgi:hypothetical protein